MKLDDKIYIAGHDGLVGSSLTKSLNKQGFTNIITRPRSQLDLTKPDAVANFFSIERPDFVFLAAARVGGILDNASYPAEFIFDNLRIATDVIHNAYIYGTKKLIYLGTACAYPKLAPQPIKEEYLLTGPLEPTNQPYAISKIAGITMCQSYNTQYGTQFISVMPTNLYGPGDNFDPEKAHVLPALLRKFIEAKIHNHPSVTVWGTGAPTREFLYIDDLANALIFLMNNYHDGSVVNIGTGHDISINNLASTIKDITQYQGNIIYDHSKPDGQPLRCLDVSKIHQLGWRHQTNLREGLIRTHQWYTNALRHHQTLRTSSPSTAVTPQV